MIKKVIINLFLILIIVSLIYASKTPIISVFFDGLPTFMRVVPDIFLILTVFSGIFYGSFFAMVFGFFAGLALDISTYPLLGFYSLIYTIIGYLTAIPEKKLDFERVLTSSMLIFVFIIIKAFLFLLVGFLYLKNGEIIYYFKDIFFVQFIYTLLVSIPIFLIYNKINNKLGSQNKNG